MDCPGNQFLAGATFTSHQHGDIGRRHLAEDNTARDAFVQQFGSSSGAVRDYQAGIPQALALMNGSLSNLSAGEDTSRLLRGLRAPFFSDKERIETVFLALVGRLPASPLTSGRRFVV